MGAGGPVGKIGSVFTSTGTGAGNESTVMSFVNTLMHHGMIYVGLPYACPGFGDISEVKGARSGSAATIAGADGSRCLPPKNWHMRVFRAGMSR